MDKIKLCVVSPLYHPMLGGVGRQAVALTEYLGRSGVSAFVLCRDIPNLPEWKPAEGVQIKRLKTLGDKKHDLEEKTAVNLLISLSFCFRLIGALVRMRKDYDIVHFHGASLPLITAVLPLTWMKKRIVAKVAGAKMKIEAGSFRNTYLGLGNLFLRLLRCVHAFIAITSEIRDDLLKDGINRERIFETTNFIMTTEFFPVESRARKDALRKELGLPADRTIIVFSGRLVQRKRIDVLLRAIAVVSERYPAVHCLILGHGELHGQLEHLAKELGVRDLTDFRSFVPNIREFLQASDMLVFPSEKEGMPNSLLEAMACGLTVVATTIGGVLDIVSDTENGLLVPPGDTAACADAIQRLIGDPDLNERLRERGLTTIRERFSIDAVAPRYLSLYRRLLDAE